jgi:prepilin-type N-terminal cleavage/methylation domain-containing protein
MMPHVLRPAPAGFTITETLTAVVVAAVLVAIALPVWRTHQLRTRRADAIAMLMSVQKAQDVQFGRQARYAPMKTQRHAEDGPPSIERSRHGFYRLDLQVSDDGLSYLATARAQPGGVEDSRCVALSIDQNGRRRAVDAAGEDRTADCWR